MLDSSLNDLSVMYQHFPRFGRHQESQKWNGQIFAHIERLKMCHSDRVLGFGAQLASRFLVKITLHFISIRLEFNLCAYGFFVYEYEFISMNNYLEFIYV
jgi:hypothetical protein